MNPFTVKKMLELDFLESDQGQAFSREDRKFPHIVQKGICLQSDGHYKIPLPLKDKDLVLPNNHLMARNRLRPLKKTLEFNQMYQSQYVEFVNKVIQMVMQRRFHWTLSQRKAATLCDTFHTMGYTTPRILIKLDWVFDFSAQFEGQSLNKHLPQGPDFRNILTGVLCSFHKEPVALMYVQSGECFRRMLLRPVTLPMVGKWRHVQGAARKTNYSTPVQCYFITRLL